jgi:hypothetical protein
MIFSHASPCIAEVQQHRIQSLSCVPTWKPYSLVIKSLEGLTFQFKSWIELRRERLQANIIVVFVDGEDRSDVYEMWIRGNRRIRS